MSKYDPFATFLKLQPGADIPMTFEEIERVLGFPLPSKAQNHRAWWSNNDSNSRLTKAWRSAGYRAERVDMVARRLVFKRAQEPRYPAGVQEPPPVSIGLQGDLLERIRARLGGTVKVAEGVDLTAPTGEVWNAEIE